MRWNAGKGHSLRRPLQVAVLTAATTFALPAAAEIGPYLGVEAGWSANLDQALDARVSQAGSTLATGSTRVVFHNAFVGGATAGYALPGHLRPELEVNYRRHAFHGGRGAVGAIAVMGNVWYDFEERGSYFYFGGGLGDLHLKLSGNFTGVGSDSDTDDVLGYQFGGGAGFFVTPQLSVGLDYRYTVGAQKADYAFGPYAANNGPVQLKIRSRYRSQAVLLGIRYNFGRIWNPLNVTESQRPVRVVPLESD